MPDGAGANQDPAADVGARLVYSPWNLHAYRYENVLVQPWLLGYKYNAFNRHPWAYYDVDSKRRKSGEPLTPRRRVRLAAKAASSLAARFGATCAALLALAALLIAPLAQAQPKWADPAKTLRVTFPIAETGFDPQATSDYYSSHVERAIFDPLYQFDYLARPHRDRPQHGGGDARDLGGWPHWKIRVRPGHLLHRRSCVQGQEARARRGGLRLFVEAASRPEDPCADAVVPRRQDRRGRRRSREGEAGRAPRLRPSDRGAEGARPLHAADHPEGARLRAPGLPDAGADGGGRARGDRGVRRRVGLGDGQSGRHRSLPPEGVAARAEDRARSESGFPRRATTRRAPTRPIASSSRR